jgi:hypothetical protein
MFCALVFAFALGFVPRVLGQGDVKAILEKAVRAHGGADKINRGKGVLTKAKGKIEVPGIGATEFTQEITVTYTGKFKEAMQVEVNGQKINVVTVFDGKNGWVSANGKTQDANGDILESLKEGAYAMKIARLTDLIPDSSIQLSALGESKVEDRPALGVKLAGKGHRDIELYFDKESGLLVKVHTRKKNPTTGQEVDEERIIKAYQEIDGQKTAKTVLVKHNGKTFLEAEVTAVKYPDDIDDNEFEKP